MQGISIFKQTHAAGASRVVMGFDSAINTYSPYAIGCIVGKSYAMAAAVVNEDSDQWHIVNLNTKHGFDAVAVLGAIDEDEAASIAMRDFGRFKESAMWDSVIATNTGGLKRYIDSPLCVKGRKVFTGEIGAMQDMAAGQKILWDGICLQSHQGSIRVLLSDMVQHDDESALVEKFDGLNAWLAESDVEVMEFDALVVENYRLEQTMAKLASAMGAASGQGGVSVTNVTQTKAVKLRNSGAIQVGVSFELSDGQAVTAIFNHADSETQKLGLKDTLFSWKWKLNSRDISAAVQPNNFENVKLDILAGRIMKLVNANSARFQRSQAKKLENEQALADGNARIAEKKATLESLKSEIESLHIQADEKAKADQAAIETKVEDQTGEPEQHYSEKIIAQLIAAHGWTKADTTTSAKKEFAGLGEAGLLSDGGRIIYATFIGDAKRYLSLQVGYGDIFDMDMRPYGSDDESIADGAKEFNAKVEEWVLAKRGVGVAAKDGDGKKNASEATTAVEKVIIAAKKRRKESVIDNWLAKNSISELDAQRLIEIYEDEFLLGQAVSTMAADDIPFNMELLEKEDAKLFYYYKAYEHVVKSLSDTAFDALKQSKSTENEKTAFYAYVVLRYSQKKSEFDYIRELGYMKNNFRIASQRVGGKLYKMAMQYLENDISKQEDGDDMSKAVAPLPQEIDIVNLEKMGVVQITEQGSENIYFVKDGREYYAKVQNTEDYPVGEFDLGKYPQGLPRTSAVDPKDADLNYIKSVIDGSLKADTPDSIKDLNDQLTRISMAQMTNPDDRLDGLLSRAIDIASKAVPSRSATNPDAEYLQAIIDGTADLSVAGDELERIGDNLSPELEELFEEAAEAYAQYAIGLE